MAAIDGQWKAALGEEFRKPYYKKLYDFVVNEYRTRQIFPKASDIYKALELTSLDQVKVVILGQDPYHNDNQAHGLAFSVPKSQSEIPPSLQNIYKEINEELGIPIPQTGELTCWAEQGVLLLNTVLTVRAHMANSHKGAGWEEFTDAIIRAVEKEDRPVVYMLWGSNARAKASMITNKKHLVLEAPHPSPLSAYRGFFGCGHFKRANEFLEENGVSPVDWSVR